MSYFEHDIGLLSGVPDVCITLMKCKYIHMIRFITFLGNKKGGYAL